jgi:tetratricopeptide (TPR) repeat protein
LLAATLPVAALVSGCAQALREPPPVTEIAAAAGREGTLPGEVVSAVGVDLLLGRAEELFATRDLAQIQAASRVWLQAAAADGSRIEGLVGAVRALVWITDHDSDPRAREEAATEAVQAAQWCGRAAPDEPACDYWLGAALGVQARERSSTALSALPMIEAAFRRAAAAAPALDDAGPDRALALLYVRAPGWPTGPGDADQGLEHARKAAALRPDHPPNLLALAEALSATGDRDASRESCRRALDLARDRAGKGDRDAPEWIQEAEKALAAR